MTPKTPPIEHVLTLLGEAPPRIAEAVAGVSARRLRVGPAPDEWSAVEVLAHLRACADVWGGCIETILAEDAPTSRAVSPRTWIRSTDYSALASEDSLRAFEAQRTSLLADLRSLTPKQWSRTA